MNFNRLMHTPVTDIKTSKRVGRLSDIILSENGKQIIGIVVTNDALLYSKRFYLWTNVKSVSVFGIGVYGFGDRYYRTEELEKNVSLQDDVYGKTVQRGGMEIGIMRDAEFDLKSAELLCLEISRGLTEDLLHGRDSLSVKQGFKTNKSELCVCEQEELKKKKHALKKFKEQKG